MANIPQYEMKYVTVGFIFNKMLIFDTVPKTVLKNYINELKFPIINIFPWKKCVCESVCACLCTDAISW